jgi:hypothetical protein
MKGRKSFFSPSYKRAIDEPTSNNIYKSIDELSIKHISSYIDLQAIMDYEQSVALAHEIAESLNDQESFPLYLAYTNRHPEEKLKELLRRTLSISDYKIKRSRGALFTYLVEQYAKSKRDDSWY